MKGLQMRNPLQKKSVLNYVLINTTILNSDGVLDPVRGITQKNRSRNK